MIVEDVRIIRDGLESIFRTIPGIKIAAIAEDGEEAVYFAKKGIPIDVILMDVELPGINGIEATERILELRPSIKVIGQSLVHSKAYVKKMVRAGARGMIFKESDQEEFAHAIRTVYEGNVYFANKISQILLQDELPIDASAVRNSLTSIQSVDELTRREKEVLKLILGEKTSVEIAEILCISRRTVETHRRNLLGKVGAKSSIGLVMFAMRHKIVFDPDEFPRLKK